MESTQTKRTVFIPPQHCHQELTPVTVHHNTTHTSSSLCWCSLSSSRALTGTIHHTQHTPHQVWADVPSLAAQSCPSPSPAPTVVTPASPADQSTSPPANNNIRKTRKHYLRHCLAWQALGHITGQQLITWQSYYTFGLPLILLWHSSFRNTCYEYHCNPEVLLSLMFTIAVVFFME